MSPLAILFMTVVFLVMPAMAIRSARQLERMRVKPGVLDILVSTVLVQGLVTTLGVFAARAEGIALFPTPTITPRTIGAGLLFLASAVVANIWRWRVMTESQRLENSWLRPQGRRDLFAWAGISLVAGICEEIIYRGILYGLVRPLVGSDAAAIALCVLAFGLGHWVQGRGAMLIVVLFAVGFHLLVATSGDLYTAMAVHVIYDFLAGLLLLRLARDNVRAAAAPSSLPPFSSE